MTGRRGITLIVVLVIVIVAALVGAGALDSGRAIAGVARTSADQSEARALALAGVRAVAEDLLEQRDDLLAGADATLPDELELWSDGERRAVAILLPVGPDGETLVSETAKLDLNRADALSLARLPEVDDALASAIISARPGEGYSSVSDLIAVKGVSPELLFGERDRWAAPWREADAITPGGSLALADLLTVFGAEPNLQRGLNEVNKEFAGQKRINLNRRWTDDVRGEIAEIFDEDIVETVRTLNQAGAFNDRETFVRTLDSIGVGTDDWNWILDLFCTTPDPYLIGLVDVNRARPEVLACLPGMDEEKAKSTSDMREGLSEEQLASEVWLLTQGVVSSEEFRAMTTWVSARSMQWRVRVRTGYVVEDDGAYAPGEVTELRFERVTEAVIDLSGPRPRLALLEDLTDRPLLASLISIEEEEPDGSRPLVLAPASDADDAEPGADEAERPRRGLQNANSRALDRRAAERDLSEDEQPNPQRPTSEGIDRRTGRWTNGVPRGQMASEEPSP